MEWMGGFLSNARFSFLFKKIFVSFLLFIYLHWVLVAACGSSLGARGNLSSLVGSNLGSLPGEHRVLASGPPGKSPVLAFQKRRWA